MKNYLYQRVVIGILAILLSWQHSLGQITATQKQTFTSINPKIHTGLTKADVQKLDLGEIFATFSTSSGGILADADGGRVTLKVNYYDENSETGIGPLLYECKTEQNSNNFIAVGRTIHKEDFHWIIFDYFDFGTSWPSTDIATSALRANLATRIPSVDPWTEEVFGGEVPIIVTVEIENATLHKFKVSGMGEHDALTFFRQLPPGHGCIGKSTAECESLKEIRYGDKKQVMLSAHRGNWGYGNQAESSMAALRNGYENKYIFIELDILQSKDGELLLLHDQKINRMISLGKDHPTFDDGLKSESDVRASWIQNLNYHTTSSGILKPDKTTYDAYPALKTGFMLDRKGRVTPDPVSRLDDALAYIQEGDKPILLSLDIKEEEKKRYLNTFSKCIAKAKEYGALHKTVFKPGSTIPEFLNPETGKIEARPLTKQDFFDYLNPRNQWVDFAYRSNILPIVVINANKTKPTYIPPTREFIDGWLSIPSLICVEYIYKYNDAQNDVLLKSTPEFDNKSVIAYTKDRGIRTGAFWEIATDCRGIPSGSVYAWYSKDHEAETLLPDNGGLINLGIDARNNPEFIISPPTTGPDPEANFPGMINTDRPDLMQSILELHGRYSTKSKRP